MQKAGGYDVAIIGGGFCGSLVAINLLRATPYATVMLFDKTNSMGPGLAYSTLDDDHLLNVRAKMMGAFADDPPHFWRWIRANGLDKDLSDMSFFPRKRYGDYLKDLLGATKRQNSGLETHAKQIVEIVPATGGGFVLHDSDGAQWRAEKVVLALGNFPPTTNIIGSSRENPYARQTVDEAAGDGDVLLVGSGLTALDLVVSLAKVKPRGKIILLSRHGLLPREHVTPAPYHWQTPFPEVVTALGLLRLVRSEIDLAKRTAWQDVIDALRPVTQSLWHSASVTERRKFLRHIRSFWEVHRHRCAPQIMDVYCKLRDAGRLELHKGRILTQAACAQGWKVVWRARDGGSVESFTVRHIVGCTGPQADFARIEDPLVQNLLGRRLIEPDELHLGVKSNGQYAARTDNGIAIAGLYVIGSLIKGELYESVAVPELRRQALEVSQLLSIDLREHTN